MNERLEQAKKLMDISAKMREVAGDIITLYESREISYTEFMQLIDNTQNIMNMATEKAFAIYDSLI